MRRLVGGQRWAWALFTVILIAAAHERFRLPQTPFSDPDAWAYLNPGLSQLLGEGFRHTLGQCFLYLGFIEMVLLCGGICVGFASRNMLWMSLGACYSICPGAGPACFSPRRNACPRCCISGLGLLVVIEEQFSLSIIPFEHTLRPEALFSFFAVLQVWLVIEFLRARWLENRPRAVLLAGGCAVFISWVLFFLKPAVGLALIPANLPVVLSLFTPGMSLRRKCLLVAAPALALLLLLLIPEWRLRRSDSEDVAFLPETLFTIHANLIHRQMAEDLADGAAVPYPRDWLIEVCSSLERELGRSAAPAARPYPSLGFNTDYLKSRDSIILQLQRHWHYDSRALAAFCSFYYWRALEHHPVAMAGKILRQLGVFYAPWRCPAYRMSKRISLALAYETSLASFGPQRLEKMNRYPPTRAYLLRCEFLRREPVLPRLTRCRGYLNLNSAFAYAYLTFLLVWLALFIVSLCGHSTVRWRGPALLILLLHAYSFGINLTLATTHSLDITRYSQNQLIFVVLAEGFTTILLLELLLSTPRPQNAIRATAPP